MTTLERLAHVLAQRYKLDPARLTPEQPLNGLGIDSLGMVEMLFFIEEDFGVYLPSEGFSFGTVGEAATYIDELIAAQKTSSQPRSGKTPGVQPASADPSA